MEKTEDVVLRGGRMGEKKALVLLVAVMVAGCCFDVQADPAPHGDVYDQGQDLVASRGRGFRAVDVPQRDFHPKLFKYYYVNGNASDNQPGNQIELENIFTQAVNNRDNNLEDSDFLQHIPGKNYKEKIDFIATRMADQQVYDAQLLEAKQSGRFFSNAEATAHVNHVYYNELNPEHWARTRDMQAVRRLTNLAAVRPTFGRKVTKFVLGDAVGGWSSFYNKHQDKFNSLVKLSLLLSTATYVFNKLGGSEYVKNKIRELFNKPTVYTVRRRKAGLMKKQGAELVKRSDLVLSSSVDRQISEIIFLINRRVEMAKLRKRKYAFPFILLYGPPGTGKTKIAQMIADQTIGDNGQPMNFIALMASDFMKIKDQGDRMDVLERMFAEANRLGNCIIFLDEVDGMTGQRGADGGETTNRAFLDKLLEKMATPSSRFMVIGATNHFNRMDDALLSRFRRKIYVGLPQPKVRQIILDKYVDKLLVNNGYKTELNTAAIADVMKGDSGRDIEAFVVRLRDAIDYAGKAVVTQKDAEMVLRDLGRLPPLESDLNAPADLAEDLILNEESNPSRQDVAVQADSSYEPDKNDQKDSNQNTAPMNDPAIERSAEQALDPNGERIAEAKKGSPLTKRVGKKSRSTRTSSGAQSSGDLGYNNTVAVDPNGEPIAERKRVSKSNRRTSQRGRVQPVVTAEPIDDLGYNNPRAVEVN